MGYGIGMRQALMFGGYRVRALSKFFLFVYVLAQSAILLRWKCVCPFLPLRFPPSSFEQASTENAYFSIVSVSLLFA